MSKQTAVEWLQDKLNNVKPTQFCSIDTIKEWVEQAKEMEKEQIINAHGDEQSYLQDNGIWIRLSGTEYYEETFKNEKKIILTDKTTKMENKEEKETSLDYFFRVTKNNAINLGRLIEMYVPAKKIYDMEIEEAKKESFKEAKKMYMEEIAKAYADGFLYGREVFYNPNENK